MIHKMHASQLLRDRGVRRWHDNLLRGSPHTASGHLRRLSLFCRMRKTTPAKLAKMNQREIADMLEDHVTDMESQGKAPGYIENHIVAVGSWMRHNDVPITRRIRVTDKGMQPTLEDEQTPTPQEMTSAIKAAPRLREAVMLALVSMSGIRPGVMGNHDGTDGLRISDLQDVTFSSGPTPRGHIGLKIRTSMPSPPIRITVRRKLSKARHQYFTFLGGRGANLILRYLDERIRDGEQLGPDSPVISPREHDSTWRASKRQFMRSQMIGDKMRAAIRAGGRDWRPYLLRAYFDTQLLIAEANGNMVHDFRVFFMGHTGSMEAKYTTNKAKLPDEMLILMRKSYMRAYPFLDGSWRASDG